MTIKTISELPCEVRKVTEKMVLSKTLSSRRVSPDVLADYFTGEERALYEEILAQWAQFGNIDTRILKNKYPDAVNDCLQLDGSLSDQAISELHNAWTNRELGNILNRHIDTETPEDEIRKIQQELADVLFVKKSDKYDHAVESIKLLDAIEEAQKAKNQLIGYSTKLKDIDIATGGIIKGRVYAIGALKKTGKSRFGVFLSIALKSQGAGIYWNSLEMSAMELNKLALSYYSAVNSDWIGKELARSYYEKMAEGFGYLRALDWSIYKDHTAAELKSRILYERQKKKIDVVFVDFIQRMRSPKYLKDRVREVENIAQDLADIARDLNVAIIEFSQLAGAAENLKPEELANMSHFKESQGIPENADSIWTINNTKRHENVIDEFGNYVPRTFRVLIEQRHSISGAIVDINADLRTCRFTDVIK